MVERMYEKAKEDDADIVVCDYYFEEPMRQTYISQPAPVTGRECVGALLGGGLHGSTWNKLVRLRLYNDNGVGFVPGIDIWEDLTAMVKLSWFAGRVSHLPEALVHYWQGNSGSLVRIITRKAIDDRIDAMAEMERFIKERGAEGRYREDIIRRKVSVRFECLYRTSGAEQKKIARLYRDIPRRYIFRQPDLPSRYKTGHYLATLGLLGMANRRFGTRQTAHN